MPIRKAIKKSVHSIVPFDTLEQAHKQDVLSWLDSDAPIFRIQKDAIPPKHLVSYAIVLDVEKKKIFLCNHKKAQKLLPTGGHVDIDELPDVATKRELFEEIGLDASIYRFDDEEKGKPFFLTVTDVTGLCEPHTDVSLWYLFAVDSDDVFAEGESFADEFDGGGWYGFEEVLAMPIAGLDVHMHRFLAKIQKILLSRS